MDNDKEKSGKKNINWLNKRKATARIVAAIIVVLVLLSTGIASCYGLRNFLLFKNPHFICRKLDFQPTANFTSKRVKTILEEMDESERCVFGRNNLLKLNIRAIKEKLLSFPSVRDVKVHRIIPDTLKIELTERVPFAILTSTGNLDALIDREGYVFPHEGNSINIDDFPLIMDEKTVKQLPMGEKCNESGIMAALAFLEYASKNATVKGVEFKVSAIVLNHKYERLECHLEAFPENKIFANGRAVVLAPFDAKLIDPALGRFYEILAIRLQNGEIIKNWVDLTLEKNIPVR